MIVYSFILALALVAWSPWWLWRMATGNRYTAGLAGRLGVVPHSLDESIARRGAAAGLVWVHAVSVGEVLAVQRLLAELQAALPGYLFAVSTTTETGQHIARAKLAGVAVFYYPLDFAFAVRRYLRVLRPTIFVTVESELWPRMLVECARAGVPVAVVNARMSDRSFRRSLRLRRLWKPLLRKVNLFLAQGEETAARLRALGVAAPSIEISGNLKYEPTALAWNAAADVLRESLQGQALVVAGSTLAGEEDLILSKWPQILAAHPRSVLLLAPRHPQRFAEVEQSDAFRGLAQERWKWSTYVSLRGSDAAADATAVPPDGCVILLDTLGDLHAIYALAAVAFVGGSLVARGGHNPLEPAGFAVPVVIGPSYENFREVVAQMLDRNAIQIVDAASFAGAVAALLQDDGGLGQRGKNCFDSQAGATAKTVRALRALLGHTP